MSNRMIRVWAREQTYGTELAEITLGEDAFAAVGVAIGAAPVPYRLEYELSTGLDYVTSRLVVKAQGKGWVRSLVLDRAASGRWSCMTWTEGDPNLDWTAPGGGLTDVAGALDCDLGLSPVTNSMPVLRHGLHRGGGPADFLMAWVSVPELAVSPSRQRYTFIRRDEDLSIVRFESLDAPFASELHVDDAGVVVDYPGIARRVAG